VPYRRVAVRGTLVALVALQVAACTGSGGTSPTTSSTPQAPTTTIRFDDGVLRVGAILPSGSVAPDLGVSMQAALEVATKEINDAGGVNGTPVSVTIVDEGETVASATGAVKSLIDSGVDAVIGPTASTNLLSTLATSVQAGALTCTPTGSALALDDYPSSGLLVRTVPSDSLQASAIAQIVSDTGEKDAAIVFLDDAFGRPLATAVSEAMGDNTTIIGTYGFAAGQVPSADIVQKVVDVSPSVIVVIADAVTGPAIISAIDDASRQRPIFVTNDSLRRPDPNASPFAADLVDARFAGAAPTAYPPSGPFRDALASLDPNAGGLYAVNAYDCLALIALGANVSGSDDGRRIAASLPELTSTGTACTSYTACTEALKEQRNIDYDGPGQFLSIDAKGQTTSARFEVFTFDAATGRDIVKSRLVVGSP
jgi:branched-chain amino acid transport system substrate-binding protein